jgi:hypothetical protein
MRCGVSQSVLVAWCAHTVQKFGVVKVEGSLQRECEETLLMLSRAVVSEQAS